MADAADGVVGHGAAQVFLGDVLVGDGLDHVGAGDEHVAGGIHHEDEIGDGGRVDGAAGARSHDGGNLRDHARGQRVAQENIGVAGQRHHAFLNARAAGIVEADDGRAVLQGEVHDLADFLRVGFRERAAEDGEVLREDVDQAAVDAAVAGDEAVAGDDLLVHAEIAAAMGDELVELFEGAFVEQQFDALARGEFAFFVLAVAAFFAAALLGGGVAAAQLLELVHGLIVAGGVARRGSDFPASEQYCSPRMRQQADNQKKGPLQNSWKLACVLAAASLANAGAAPQVLTESGAISGVSASGLTVFKGVPFAAPPVGDLRWRPPMPAAPWTGTRKADAFAPACMQTGCPHAGRDAAGSE